jgi:predicted amidophosphoribosyltransferase
MPPKTGVGLTSNTAVRVFISISNNLHSVSRVIGCKRKWQNISKYCRECGKPVLINRASVVFVNNCFRGNPKSERKIIRLFSHFTEASGDIAAEECM